ncbi:MAG: hypothetical protein BAJALOKI2v1_80015 [Promethearchaeota archaeon]|nr:MAG: hypothetical protein BAJALOKI2v1_80015 [Candidatus Lokiarchaeota archaeon]
MLIIIILIKTTFLIRYYSYSIKIVDLTFLKPLTTDINFCLIQNNKIRN